MESSQLKSAADLREFKRKKVAKKDVVDQASVGASEYGQIPLLRYTIDLARIGISEVNAGPSRNKGIEAFFLKDGIAVTIALAATTFTKDDERLFYSIVDSAKFVDNSTPRNSFDYYQEGRALFLQGEYSSAIGPLSRALELEQKNAQLPRADWRTLVLDLANAYGAAGNRSGFEEVMQYGMSHDPTYYRFHFTKARMYAYEGKLDETIASLEKAFIYHKNETQATQIVERLPDPLYEPAFERFRKDDKFRNAVKSMKRNE